MQNKHADDLQKQITPKIKETINLLSYASAIVTTIYEKTKDLNYKKLAEAGRNAARQILLGKSEAGIVTGLNYMTISTCLSLE